MELLCLLAILSILATFMILPSRRGPHAHPARINCTNNLKQVGLAFHQWALDHNDKFPMQTSATNGGTMELVGYGFVWPHFQVLSNELNTPKILVCPADAGRQSASSFASNFNSSAISYFVGVDADEVMPQMFLAGDRNITNRLGLRSGTVAWTTNEFVGWTYQMHGRQGNVALADGSVQGFSSSRLREALRNTGVATNRLAMP